MLDNVYIIVLEALLCDRPFIFPLFDDLGTYCLFGADVTQTNKCLTMIILVSGLLSSDYNILSTPQGRVLKVFITNLPSTCWLARISGQFCDGSFSKSVINTKTALTRLSIQNNLFLRATFIIMGCY